MINKANDKKKIFSINKYETTNIQCRPKNKKVF